MSQKPCDDKTFCAADKKEDQDIISSGHVCRAEALFTERKISHSMAVARPCIARAIAQILIVSWINQRICRLDFSAVEHHTAG